MFIKELNSAKEELHELELNKVDTSKHHPERIIIDEIERGFEEVGDVGWDVPPQDYPDDISSYENQVGFNEFRKLEGMPDYHDDPMEAVKDVEESVDFDECESE